MIGGGWVAYFLARGYRVVAWDPAEDAETRLRHLVGQAWPALVELGLSEGASQDNLVVEHDLATACAQADFVQESAPEDLELKRTLLADIDAATPAGRRHLVVDVGVRHDRDAGPAAPTPSAPSSGTRSTRRT